MRWYFLRRTLLIVPTFLGITLVVFVIMQFVPGGPVERQILRFQMAMAGGGEGGGGTALRGGVEIPQEEIDEIRRYYGFDKPVAVPSGPRKFVRLPGSRLGRD
jgi:microcin C transport system permease protein